MNRPIEWPLELVAAATLLIRAAKYAEELQSPLWDFAVEIEDLFANGLSRVDLRWLACHGLVEHLAEFSHGPSAHRQFRTTGKLTFSDGTCFVLTPFGMQAARSLVAKCATSSADAIVPSSGYSNSARYSVREFVTSELVVTKPIWNAELFRLSLGELIVKEFRSPARNQQRILAAFQEEDWPMRIDDPLPPIAELEPARRLHEAVAALNRRQRNKLLRFSADGVGRGVKWMLARGSGHSRHR